MSLTAAARAMGRGALVTKARCMSVQYKAPVRDIKFVLDEVLDADRHYDKSGYEACDRDLRHSVIEECAKFAEDVLDFSEICRRSKGGGFSLVIWATKNRKIFGRRLDPKKHPSKNFAPAAR